MKKKIIIGIFIVGMFSAAYYFASTYPIGLQVKLNGDAVYKYRPIDEKTLEVSSYTITGRKRPIKDFSFTETREEESFIIQVTAGRLQGSFRGDLVTGTLNGNCTRDIVEGDHFRSGDVELEYAYTDGTKVVPETVSFDAPDIFTEDTTIHVSCEYGETDIPVYVSLVNGIEAHYQADKIYEGDPFKREDIAVNIRFANDTEKDNEEFVVLNAPKFIQEKTDVKISTAYGETVITVDPVKISEVSFIGKRKYHEGDRFLPDGVALLYEDGTEKTVLSKDIDWVDTYGDTLALGQTDVSFSWRGKTYTSSLQVYENNAVSNAIRVATSEIEHADFTYFDEMTYVTIKKYDGYYFTHVILADTTALSSSFAGGVDYGFTENGQAAAERTKWVFGINASDIQAAPSVSIRAGVLKKGGTTDGSEICLTKDGALITPPVNTEGQELLSMGIREIWWSDKPIIVDNYEMGEATESWEDLHMDTILGSGSQGEYFFITPDPEGVGMTYIDAATIMLQNGASYARAIGSDGSCILAIEDNVLVGEDALSADFLYVQKIKEGEAD